MPTKLSVILFRRFVDENRERNSIEAAKFLVDTNNIYPTRFYFLIGKFLRFSLALGDVKLPKTYISEIIKLLKETRQNPSKRRGMCEQILNTTSKLSSQQTSAHGWKLVSLRYLGSASLGPARLLEITVLHRRFQRSHRATQVTAPQASQLRDCSNLEDLRKQDN
jgi:hypothetical protein